MFDDWSEFCDEEVIFQPMLVLETDEESLTDAQPSYDSSEMEGFVATIRSLSN